MNFFLILIISIPVFYIWGIISFIRLIFKRSSRPQQGEALNNTDRKAYLRTAIAELQKVSAVFPAKKISELTEEYKAELRTIAGISLSQTKPLAISPALSKQPNSSVEPAHNTPSIQNWYKDNSINLLLYIGAFLIVVSAT